MPDASSVALPLRIVDGVSLSQPLREALRPGEIVATRDGGRRRLPRFFYEVESSEQAQEVLLTPHFGLWEFIHTDVREARPLRGFPRYVPCAVTALAAPLEVFRQRVDTYVRIAANGGYRSPSHALDGEACSAHHWGSAANLVCVGDDWMHDEEAYARAAAALHDVLPGAWVRPRGEARGTTFDHLHVELGYVVLVPPGVEDEADA